MIGFAILCLAMYAILLGLMYAVPGLFLTVLAALILPLFGVPVEFGWTLFGQSVAVVFVYRLFYTWFYMPPGKQIMFPLIEFAKSEPRQPELNVVEDPAGCWSYHLSNDPFDGKSNKTALCGKTGQMQTRIPVAAWGTVSHLREKWCPTCAAKAGIPGPWDRRDPCRRGDGRNFSVDEHIAEGIHELAKLQ